MITSPQDFKQKLLEIQNSVDVEYTSLPLNEPHFMIDANTRTITIPPEFGFLSVKNDHKAENIYFEIDRYFDYEDLSNHTCIVQYSYKGFEGIYPVTSLDVESIDGKILFCWTIMNDATRDFGDINFSVRFYSIEDNEYTYNFNTLTASSKILDTLDVNHYPYDSPTPEQFQIYIDKTNEISDKMDDFSTTVTESEQNALIYAEQAKEAYNNTVSQYESIVNTTQQSISEIQTESSNQLINLNSYVDAAISDIQQEGELQLSALSNISENVNNVSNEIQNTFAEITDIHTDILSKYTEIKDTAESIVNDRDTISKNASDIVLINEKLPFSLGIDENGNCGFIKPGEDTVTPFGSGGGGTSRTVGTIENLQMVNITGLTSEVTVDPVTE